MNNKRVGPPPIADLSRIRPIEAIVEGSSREDFEGALRRFKAAFQKERVVGQIKEKMQHEKPSEKKRRKLREARDRRLMTESRERMMKSGEWDRRQKTREQGKINRSERKSEVFE